MAKRRGKGEDRLSGARPASSLKSGCRATMITASGCARPSAMPLLRPRLSGCCLRPAQAARRWDGGRGQQTSRFATPERVDAGLGQPTGHATRLREMGATDPHPYRAALGQHWDQKDTLSYTVAYAETV